jgi:hypothetical protein
MKYHRDIPGIIAHIIQLHEANGEPGLSNKRRRRTAPRSTPELLEEPVEVEIPAEPLAEPSFELWDIWADFNS